MDLTDFDSILVRCSLSFLSIQAPGKSKYCGLCEREYLSDTVILKELGQHQPRVEPRTDDAWEQSLLGTTEPRETPIRAPTVAATAMGDTSEFDEHSPGHVLKHVSLASLLFEACDICVYCGGKFVG